MAKNQCKTTPITTSSTATRLQHSRVRSTSLDSIPSLHPSVSDSINTLTRLLPQTNPLAYPLISAPPNKSLPALPPHAENHHNPSHTLPTLTSRNDLAPDQRTLLRRRTRKLEQVLGETLHERQIQQHVVRPTTMTVTTGFDDLWPSPNSSSKSASSSPRGVPEWQKRDAIPHRTKIALENAGKPVSRTSSKLGKVSQGSTDKDDSKVHVQREMRVSENSTRQSIRPGERSPVSPVDHIEMENLDEDDMVRRARRLQLAKVGFQLFDIG